MSTPPPLPIVTFPDIEAVICGILRTAMPGTTVDVQLPDDLQQQLPFVEVTRQGGSSALRFVLERPAVELQCYGPDKAGAHDTAQMARAALLAAAGTTTGGCTICTVNDLAFTWVPDPASLYLPRYSVTLQLLIRPA